MQMARAHLTAQSQVSVVLIQIASGAAAVGASGAFTCRRREMHMPRNDQTTADLVEARKQGLLDAAGILREWLQQFGSFQPTYISPQTWASDAIKDCIAQIEGMAGIQMEALDG
jgi:hypothetical protein